MILVPGGVGGLLAAVVDWTRAMRLPPAPHVCVEPATAACLLVSARAGRPTTLPGPFDTAMAGLRCGEVSRAGFDAVRGGVAAYVVLEDRWAFEAMRRLAGGADGDPIVRAGASGGAALGGLIALVNDPTLNEVRSALNLGSTTRAVALVSEGVTDPELFARVVTSPRNEHQDAKPREP